MRNNCGFLFIDSETPCECDFCDKKKPCARIDWFSDVIVICKDCLDRFSSYFNEENPPNKHKLANYNIHNVTGKGVVFSLHRDQNDVEGIEVNDEVETLDGDLYIVKGIECFRNNFGEIGKNIAILVKKKDGDS